jgi:hypothetical protein
MNNPGPDGDEVRVDVLTFRCIRVRVIPAFMHMVETTDVGCEFIVAGLAAAKNGRNRNVESSLPKYDKPEARERVDTLIKQACSFR